MSEERYCTVLLSHGVCLSCVLALIKQWKRFSTGGSMSELFVPNEDPLACERLKYLFHFISFFSESYILMVVVFVFDWLELIICLLVDWYWLDIYLMLILRVNISCCWRQTNFETCIVLRVILLLLLVLSIEITRNRLWTKVTKGRQHLKIVIYI